MKMSGDHTSYNRNYNRETEICQGFNGTRSHGLCVNAAVLHQLSYEDAYVCAEYFFGLKFAIA